MRPSELGPPHLRTQPGLSLVPSTSTVLGVYCGPTVCVQVVVGVGCWQWLCGSGGSWACWVGLFCFPGVLAQLACSQDLACSILALCPCRQDGGERAGCQGRQVASQPGGQSSLFNEAVESRRAVSIGSALACLGEK